MTYKTLGPDARLRCSVGRCMFENSRFRPASVRVHLHRRDSWCARRALGAMVGGGRWGSLTLEELSAPRRDERNALVVLGARMEECLEGPGALDGMHVRCA